MSVSFEGRISRCRCGHMRQNHSKFYETNLSLACDVPNCDCFEFRESESLTKDSVLPGQAEFARMTVYQARHILDAAKDDSRITAIVESILMRDTLASAPDTLFRVVLLDLGWGLPEAAILYYAAVRVLA